MKPVELVMDTRGDDEAVSCAVRVINLLGERGDERCGDLLDLR